MIKGNLKKIVDARVDRIKAGLFNCLIIFGDTRTGKSTLARKIAKYMSDELGVPWHPSTHIAFSVEEHGENSEREGTDRQIFILDEASFDLLAQDRKNEWQFRLIQYFNTAAKKNQTHIILLPVLGQIKKDFLISEHVFGLRTYIKIHFQAPTPEEMYERGHADALNCIDLLEVYELYARRQYKAYLNDHGRGHEVSFDDQEEYMTATDKKEYEERKDAAIKSIFAEKGKKSSNQD